MLIIDHSRPFTIRRVLALITIFALFGLFHLAG